MSVKILGCRIVQGTRFMRRIKDRIFNSRKIVFLLPFSTEGGYLISKKGLAKKGGH